MTREEDLLFGAFRLDPGNACVWHGQEALRLTPKAFAVLYYLAAHPDRLITRTELFEVAWSGVAVSEAALTVCIGELRRALGDEARAPQLIETVHRRGYRFIGPVQGPESGTWRLGPPGSRRSGAGSEKDQPTTPFSPQPSSLGPAGVVGREAEIGRLQRCLARARRGERQVVFVTGEPGIGKTTLIDAFLERATLEAGLWSARGQCIEHYGAGEAYLPMLEALGRLCRGPEGERLLALLGQLAPTWLVQLPALLSTAELEAAQRRVLGATRERMLRELGEAVETVTAERCLVLVLEDLHWSDASTLDLIAWLARRREPARLLLIGTYRPVEVIIRGSPLKRIKQELQLLRQCEELPLELLREVDVAQYLAARFTGSALPAVLARAIYRHTDGHPLFMVAVVDELVRQGWAAEAAGRWGVRAGIAEEALSVPESLRQMIEQQLEGLSAREQRVLEVASVAGMEFSAAAVAAGMEADVAVVEERCAELARRQQVLQARGAAAWPDGTVAECYRFRHTLYQQVVYERVSVARRRGLHRRIGLREEAGYRERVWERAAELAMHFQRGGDAGRAVQYLRQAAENALQRWAYREAVGHLTEGLELLQSLPDTPERSQQELDFQITLGPALTVTQGFAAPAVEQTYTRAWVLCRQVGETPHRFPVLWGLWQSCIVRGRALTAFELGQELLILAHGARDAGLLLRSHMALGVTLYYRGELVAARTHLEQGLALYDPQQPRALSVFNSLDPGTTCLRYVALTLWLQGHPDQALQRIEAVLALAREWRRPPGLVAALVVAARLHQHRREVPRTHERAEAAMTLAREQGFAQRLAAATILWGWALTEQGQVAEGGAAMRQGLAAFQTTGAGDDLPYWLALLAEGYTNEAQAEAGLQVAAEGLALARTQGLHVWEAELHRLKGELLLSQAVGKGDAPTVTTETSVVAEAGAGATDPTSLVTVAETCFRQALDVARQQHAKSLELRAATSLSRLWRRQGKLQAARQLLAGIYGWFTEGFDTADLKAARTLLEELE